MRKVSLGIAILTMFSTVEVCLAQNVLLFAGWIREWNEGQKVYEHHKTTRITASRDLSDLVKKGVLKKLGSGRGVYYELVS